MDDVVDLTSDSPPSAFIVTPASITSVDYCAGRRAARQQAGGGRGKQQPEASAGNSARDAAELAALNGHATGPTAALLHCGNVLLVLPNKIKVTGTLLLQGTALVFEPDVDDSEMKIQIECATVKSMQVSKAGSAKALLKLIGAGRGGSDVTLDFSKAINGISWRDTLKDAIAAIMRSAHDSSATRSSPCGSAACSGRGPANVSAAGASTSDDSGGQASKASSGKGNRGMAGCDGRGGSGENQSERIVHRLDAATIYKYMTEYPKLMEVYRKVVPDQMSEHEFWRRFLEARNFHEASSSASAHAVGRRDQIESEKAATLLHVMACDAPGGQHEGQANRKSSTNAGDSRRVAGVDEQFDLTAMEAASSIRRLSNDLHGGAAHEESGGDGKVGGIIMYVNTHQGSLLGSERDEHLRGHKQALSLADGEEVLRVGGTGEGRDVQEIDKKRRRVAMQDEPGGNLSGIEQRGRALALRVPRGTWGGRRGGECARDAHDRSRENGCGGRVDVDEQALANRLDEAEGQRCTKTRADGQGVPRNLREWRLADDRKMFDSCSLVSTLLFPCQDGCELDVPVGESIGGGGVGDELWQVEVNLREVLRHLWLQLLSKRTDAEKLSRLEAMLTKLMQRLQDFRVMLQTKVERGLVNKKKAEQDRYRLAKLLALAQAPALNSSSSGRVA